MTLASDSSTVRRGIDALAAVAGISHSGLRQETIMAFDRIAKGDSMSTVAVLNVTREEVAVRQLAKAADRMRRLEAEQDIAFGEFANAQQAMGEVGLVVDIELKPGTSAAFSAWKQEQAKARGRADLEAV